MLSITTEGRTVIADLAQAMHQYYGTPRVDRSMSHAERAIRRNLPDDDDVFRIAATGILQDAACSTDMLTTATTAGRALGIDAPMDVSRLGVCLINFLHNEDGQFGAHGSYVRSTDLYYTVDMGLYEQVRHTVNAALSAAGSRLFHRAPPSVSHGAQPIDVKVTPWAGLTRKGLRGTEYLVRKAAKHELDRAAFLETEASDFTELMIGNINWLDRTVYRVNPLGDRWLRLQAAIREPAYATLLQSKQRDRIRYAGRRVTAGRAVKKLMPSDEAIRDRELKAFKSKRWDRFQAIQRVADQHYDAVSAMAQMGRFRFDHFLDPRARIYQSGLVNGQTGLGRWIVTPASIGYLNQSEALDVIKKSGKGGAVMQRWIDRAINAEFDPSDYVAFTCDKSGEFDYKLWLSLITVSLVAAGETSDMFWGDATCSGIQMAACHLRDRGLAMSSNLRALQQKHDAYVDVAKAFKGLSGASGTPRSMRDMVKPLVMGRVYGSGEGPSRDAAMTHYRDDFTVQMGHLEGALAVALPGLDAMSNWVQECIAEVHGAGVVEPVIASPSGLRMCFSKRKPKRAFVSFKNVCGKSRRLSRSARNGRADSASAGRSCFASALLQGMDARVLHLVIQSMRTKHPESPLVTIHDAVHCSDTLGDAVTSAYREAVVSCFTREDGTYHDWLTELRDQFQALAPDADIPQIPDRGDWCVTEVLESYHCFG